MKFTIVASSRDVFGTARQYYYCTSAYFCRNYVEALDNGDMEIIMNPRKTTNFLGFRVETPVLLARSRRLADEKWTKLKNLLSHVYYLHEDYALRIIFTRNSSTAKFYGVECERRRFALYKSEFIFASTKN